LFHSDRGTQYTSDEFQQLLDSINFSQSLSNTACPYDNAVVESKKRK
ncbi:MAG: transposase family protein, partial [Synergistaceae bacterium]|nr:transposase family protein [Synergistaceae bacterium]